VSPEYISLRSGIAELRKHLLPAKFDSTGTYKHPAKVSAKAASFRVLAHAEFEAYLENRAVEIAKTAWKSWKANTHVSPVLMCLLGYSSLQMKLPPETIKPSNNQTAQEWKEEFLSLYDKLNKSVSTFVRRAVVENHGVKEGNVLSLLLPIGFDSDKIDPLLLLDLNTFGEARGRAAHSGGVYFVTQLINPADEHQKVKKLLKDLLPVDAELDTLLSSASP
jgi:hypothetical protein